MRRATVRPAAGVGGRCAGWRPRPTDWLAALGLLVLDLAAYGKLLDPRLMLADFDAYVYFFPLRAYAAMAVREGRLPLWNPDSFLGVPFLANPQTALFYPFTWLFFGLPVPYAYSLNIVLHVLLAGIGFYGFCRLNLRVAPLAGFVGASAFMLGGVLSGQYGHLNQLSAVAWLPLVLLAADRAVKRRSLRWAVVGAGLVGLQLLAGHPQQSYMTAALVGWVCLWRAWGLERRRLVWGVGIPMLVVGLGVAAAAVQLVPMAELAAESIRGGGLAYRDAVAGSLWPWLLPRALLPSFVNDLGSTEYLGYVGVAALVLAGVGVGSANRRALGLAAPLVVGGLFLAVGGANPLYELLYRVVPGMSSFRVPARWLLVFTVGIALLSAYGMSWLTSTDRARLERRGVARVAITLALLGLAGLCAYLVGVRAQRWVQVAWLGAGLASLVLAAACLRPRLRTVAGPGLALLVAAELWAAGGDLAPRWPVPAGAYAQPRDSTMFLQSRLAGGRFLSIASEEYELKESPDYREWFSELSEEALVAFLVAAKRNEILTPNLNLLYGIADVDGYDGGLLPTRRWLRLASLLVPPDRLRADGALITRLESLPPRRLMDLLGLRLVLAGRSKDHEAPEGVYDRSVLATLGPGERLELERVPNRLLSAVGLISWTEGGGGEGDTPVARIELTRVDGSILRTPIRTGRETAAGRRSATAPLPATLTELRPWTSTRADDPSEFLARVPVEAADLRRLAIVNTSSDSTLHIRALALLDERDGAFSPLVLDDRIERTTFFDMKVYEYPEVLGRAYLVTSAMEADDAEALGLLAGEAFDPRRQAVVEPGAGGGLDQAERHAGAATIVEMSAEQVRVRSRLGREALLVLSEPYYPGWTATVDGTAAPVIRTNVAFRGVRVPAGEHEIVFRFEPPSLRAGLIVSLAALVAGLVLLFGLGRSESDVMRGRMSAATPAGRER